MAKRWTAKSLDAALAAVWGLLQGEDKAGDWPDDVEREDLEHAQEVLQDLLAQKGSR